jgi:hypothetical protein
MMHGSVFLFQFWRNQGYSGEPALEIVVLRGFIPHTKSRGQEKIEKKTHPDSRARRWVVEGAHSWMNRFRKILPLKKCQAPFCVALYNAAFLYVK